LVYFNYGNIFICIFYHISDFASKRSARIGIVDIFRPCYNLVVNSDARFHVEQRGRHATLHRGALFAYYLAKPSGLLPGDGDNYRIMNIEFRILNKRTLFLLIAVFISSKIQYTTIKKISSENGFYTNCILNIAY